MLENIFYIFSVFLRVWLPTVVTQYTFNQARFHTDRPIFILHTLSCCVKRTEVSVFCDHQLTERRVCISGNCLQMSDVMVTGYGNLSKSHGKFPQTSGKTEEGLSPDKLSFGSQCCYLATPDICDLQPNPCFCSVSHCVVPRTKQLVNWWNSNNLVVPLK